MIAFLEYLIEVEGLSANDIVRVLEKPFDFVAEYDEFERTKGHGWGG